MCCVNNKIQVDPLFEASVLHIFASAKNMCLVPLPRCCGGFGRLASQNQGGNGYHMLNIVRKSV